MWRKALAQSTATPDPMESFSEGVETAKEAVVEGVTSLFHIKPPEWLVTILFALLALVVGIVLLRVGRKVLNRVIGRSPLKDPKMARQQETLRSLVNSIFSYGMYFIIATVVLSLFGVNITSLLAIAGIGGVAIGFGAQTLVRDIISGVFLWAEGNITVGDIVTLNGMTGTVESVALRTTTLRDYNGNLYVVPNGDVRTVANMSRSYKRAIVDVRLNYEEDLEYMLSILRDEMEKAKESLPGLHEDPTILGVTGLMGDCISVQIAALCDVTECVNIERALRRRIVNRFAQERILLPHGPIMATPRKDSSRG